MHLRLIRKTAPVTKIVFALFFFAASALPFVLSAYDARPPHVSAAIARLRHLRYVGDSFATADDWLVETNQPVQELRPLASLPTHWIGKWFDVNKNYAAFETWFSDNLGLRNVMIRTKNELDYQLFHSSTRVYFGQGQQIFGRHLIDVELPSTEQLLATPADIDAVYRGVVKLSEQLKAEGITTVFVTPMMKEYFIPGQLPFFAPRLPTNSQFMQLYARMKASPNLHFIDVFSIIKSIQPKYQIFYRQDFHWTNISALEVAKASTNELADLAGSPIRWQHPVVTEQAQILGSDARFAALMSEQKIPEQDLKKTWVDRHTFTTYDPKTTASTGIEFETDTINDPRLIPSACLYGNSFSDGMLAAGLPDYFQKMTKLDRMQSLADVPALMKGRCTVAIVQVLDLSTSLWQSIKQ